jgi:hypothetical protein
VPARSDLIPTVPAKARPSRRRFLSHFGTLGLATSATIFATPGRANADACTPCCDLVFCPQNISITTCQNACHNYIWSCRVCGGGSCVTCSCCERYTKCQGGVINGSAANCQPT